MTRLADVVPGTIVYTGELAVMVMSQHPSQYITKVQDLYTKDMYDLHPMQECQLANSIADAYITEPTDYDLN